MARERRAEPWAPGRMADDVMDFSTRKMLTMLVAIIVNPDADDQEIVRLIKSRGFTVSRNDVTTLRAWLVEERRFYHGDEC
jgi:hypothetical protein